MNSIRYLGFEKLITETDSDLAAILHAKSRELKAFAYPNFEFFTFRARGFRYINGIEKSEDALFPYRYKSAASPISGTIRFGACAAQVRAN